MRAPKFSNEYSESNLQIEHNQQLKCIKTTEIPSNWFQTIKSHIFRGYPFEALGIYTQIRRKGAVFVSVMPLIFKACALLKYLDYGKIMHAESIKTGVSDDVILGTSLVDLYCKCGVVGDAREVFDYMPVRNVVTWNAMIGGYMRDGDTKTAVSLFERMSMRTVVTWNEMIDGLSKNGDIGMARCLFDQVPEELRTVVTWTVMVDGYASKGEMEAAKEIFERMPERNFFARSSMISGYFTKGDVREARAVFDRVGVRNLVVWNSLISGYARNGFCEEALEAFGNMQSEGFQPDEVTVASALSACAQLGMLDAGKEIHEMIKHRGLKCNQFVLSALVDMYAKCGDLTNARVIFEGMHQKNNAVWNSVIFGFAIHGQGKEALEFFNKMVKDNDSRPDGVTFLSVLSACVHGGFVNEGLEIFSKMRKYGLTAGIKHYGCMVDLLSRAGRLKEAFDLIKRMPMKPNNVVLGAFLGACRIHMDMEMTEKVLREICTLYPDASSGNDSLHVLLANIYAVSAGWEKAETARRDMVDDGIRKTPGWSTIMLQEL